MNNNTSKTKKQNKQQQVVGKWLKHDKLPAGMTFVEKQAELISLGAFHFLQVAPETCDSLILFYFYPIEVLNDSKINRKDMIEFDDSMKTLHLDNFNVSMYLMLFQKLRKNLIFRGS